MTSSCHFLPGTAELDLITGRACKHQRGTHEATLTFSTVWLLLFMRWYSRCTYILLEGSTAGYGPRDNICSDRSPGTGVSPLGFTSVSDWVARKRVQLSSEGNRPHRCGGKPKRFEKESPYIPTPTASVKPWHCTVCFQLHLEVFKNCIICFPTCVQLLSPCCG